MTLASIDGTTVFRLRILGYQFPGITTDRYDSNWLMVNVEGKTQDTSWSGTDPCMLTWEGHWLLNWLADLATGAESEPEMSFMEMNLEFILASRTANAIGLRIRLRESLRPQSAAGDDPFDIALELLPDGLRAAADALCEDLRRFPIRAGASRLCRPHSSPTGTCILCSPESPGRRANQS